jgi:hypothetical protein
MEMAPALVGATREACRACIGYFLRHWAHRKAAHEDMLDAHVDNFLKPGNLEGGFAHYKASHAGRVAMMKGEAPELPPFFGVGDATHVAMLFQPGRTAIPCSPGPTPTPTPTLRLKAPNKRQRAAISPKLFFKLKVMASPGLPVIRTGQAVDHLTGIRNNLCVAYPH